MVLIASRGFKGPSAVATFFAPLNSERIRVGGGRATNWAIVYCVLRRRKE
jgi:hypothetical protein